MSRRTRTVRRGGGAAACAVVAALGALGVARDAAAQDPAQEWFDRAERAAASLPYDGVVVMTYPVGGRPREVEVALRSDGEHVRAEGARDVLKARGQGWLGRPEGWALLGGGSAVAGPALGAKYDEQVADGPVIAGRPTVAVTFVDRDDPQGDRDVVWFDRESGLVLGREQRDGDGDVRRGFRFVRLQVGAANPTAAVTQPRLPDPGPGAARPVDDLEGPFRDPGRVGDGFVLVARYEHPGDLAQVVYSDGLHLVSVFQEEGRIDWEALPPGRTATVDGATARRWSVPVGEVWTWARGGVVYTTVSGAPPTETAAVAAEVSAPRERGKLAQLAELLLAPFRL